MANERPLHTDGWPGGLHGFTYYGWVKRTTIVYISVNILSEVVTANELHCCGEFRCRISRDRAGCAGGKSVRFAAAVELLQSAAACREVSPGDDGRHGAAAAHVAQLPRDPPHPRPARCGAVEDRVRRERPRTVHQQGDLAFQRRIQDVERRFDRESGGQKWVQGQSPGRELGEPLSRRSW